MPPWSSHEAPKEDGQDLHSILDTHQRGELTLLIASATESMRKGVTNIFDSAFTSEKTSKTLEKGAENPNIGKDNEDPAETLKQLKLQEHRQKQLSAPKLQELKHAAIKFFDDWRDSVISRVGDVVNSKEKAEEQKGEAVAVESHPADKHIEGTEAAEDMDTSLRELYPPIPTSLASIDKDKRTLVLHSIMLLLLSLEHYVAHSRILLLYLTSSLNLPLSLLEKDETNVSHGLLQAAKQMSGDTETEQQSQANKHARAWKVGIASVAGAAVIGITGGLAAPLVAAGIGTVMGGLGLGATTAAAYLGVLAESGVIVGSLFGAYGGSMTGKMMDEYAKEVQDFAFLPIRAPHKRHEIFKNAKEAATAERRLRVAVGITGWLTAPEEIVTPWRIIGPTTEAFALRFETEALLKLGNGMTSLFKSAAWSYAKGQIIKRTLFGALSEAFWPIALLKVGKIVDNPFSIAKFRADKTGTVLAEALINRAQGKRPVTLIGFSLGARVIYTCLMTLAERRAFGLIESVVLIGTPCPSEAADWRCIRSVVSGRVVNVFSEHDYVLGFLYRTSSIQYGVAGLEKIENVHGIENVDVTAMVSGHLRYRYLSGSILKKIGFEDLDLDEVERAEETLRLVELGEGIEAEGQAGGEPVAVEGIKGDAKATGPEEGAVKDPLAKQDAVDPELQQEKEKLKLEKEVDVKDQQSELVVETQKLHIA
jgi:hypothetical protein